MVSDVEKQSAISDYKNCTLMAADQLDAFVLDVKIMLDHVKDRANNLRKIADELAKGQVDVLDVPGRFKAAMNHLGEIDKAALVYRLEMLELYRKNYRKAIGAE